MKKIYFVIILLTFCGSVFGQLTQFRMIGSGTWTTVNDSTFSSTVTIQADLTANGFLPTGIVDSMKVFTQTGQRYRISSVSNKTFSSADLVVVESGGNWGSPVGQVLIYENRGRSSVPSIPFSATGATAKMQEAADTYNSSLIVEAGNVTDGDKGDVLITGGVWEVEGLKGTTISSTPPVSGQFLSYNGSQYTPTSTLSIVPTVYSAAGTLSTSLDLASYNIFQLDLSAESVEPELTLSNPIPGNIYTIRWWGNSTLDTLKFPDNVYCTHDTVASFLQLSNPASKSGFVQMFYDTAFFTLSCIPECLASSGGGGGGGGSYDESYQDILDWATLAGATLPPDSIQDAQNQLVLDLKAAEVWDSLGMLYVFASGSTDTTFANINWKDPTSYNVDAKGTLTYDRLGGYKSDNSTGYLETNMLNDLPGWTTTNAHVGVYSEDAVSPVNDSYIMSWWNGNSSARALLLADANSSNFSKWAAALACNTDNSSVTDLTGYFVSTLRAGTGYVYRNASAIADASPCTGTGLGATSDRTMILLASYQNIGSPVTSFSQVKMSIFHAGAALSAAKVGLLNTAFSNYRSSL